MRGRRRQEALKKIQLPVDTTLVKTLFVNLKHVFIVDLSSYAGSACNELLHQLLFGEILNQEEVKIIVVMKAKFSPKCQCGVGEKNVDKNFYKNRFIVEGNGRIVLDVDRKTSSKKYRDALISYILQIVPDAENRVHVHSEDYIDALCKIYSVITPVSETLPLLDYFKIGFKSINENNNQSDSNNNNNSDNNSNNDSINSSGTSITRSSYSTPKKSVTSRSILTTTPKKKQLHQNNNNNNNNISTNETDVNYVVEKVKQWLIKRIKHTNDIINLPKTRVALESAIKPFCTVYKDADIQALLSILHESGDISLCLVCQSCKPTNLNPTSYYFERKRIPTNMMEHCQSLMSMLNTQYSKNNQHPIQLTSITPSAFKDKLCVSETQIVDKLIQLNFISIVEKDNNDNDNNRYSYSTTKTTPKQHLEYTEIANYASQLLDNELESLLEQIEIKEVEPIDSNSKNNDNHSELSAYQIQEIIEPQKQSLIVETNGTINLSINTPTSKSKYKYFTSSPRTPTKDYSFF